MCQPYKDIVVTNRAICVAVLVVCTLAAVVFVATASGPGPDQKDASMTPETASSTVSIRVFSTTGELVGPLELPRVELSEAEWRERLTEEQFRILRNDGTEVPFCGNLLDNKKEGVYQCAGCGLALFTSDSKFTSGTGWPSFFTPVAKENVIEHQDRSHGMVRTEITCARCDGHLGHVFADGPAPTGLRYCVNSESLTFVESTKVASIAEVSEAVFAGGCFWCTEAVFEQLAGVHLVESGYAGGDGPATYESVVTGTTGHAESIRIVFDPKIISYETLLEVHFVTHDPTQLNRQGNDIGTHYRSAIFYANDAQKKLAQSYIEKLEASKAYDRQIVTTLEPLTNYTRAEAYHQDYAARNPDQPYIRAISQPKVEKVRKHFEGLLKPTASDSSAD